MSHRIHTVAVLAALVATPTMAQSQTSFSVSGGLNAPVAKLGDIADIGYNVAASLNLGGTALPVALRFEGGYNGLGLKSGGDVRIVSGTANAVFNIGKTPDSPYLLAGLGAYSRRLNFGSLGSLDDKAAVGINGGGGIRFPLTGLSTFFEARYHIMLGTAADATNYQFIPITFGITF